MRPPIYYYNFSVQGIEILVYTLYGSDEAVTMLASKSQFFQAACGVSCAIPLNMKVICYKCDGTRSEMGYRGNVCPYCEGTGIETVKVNFFLEKILLCVLPLQ